MTDGATGTDDLLDGFRMGDFVVEPDLQRISGKGRDVRVEPKIMDVLVLLARERGKTVTKETFMREVWTGTIVSADALLRCISELRRLLDDDPQHPKYIETIRKRGYRLVAPVLPRGTAPEELAAVAPPSVSEGAPSDSYRADDLQRSREKVNPGPAHVEAGPKTRFAERSGVQRIVMGVVLLALVSVVIVVALQIRGFGTNGTSPLVAQPLTSLEGVESDPNISPDGSRLAFVWDGAAEANFDIYVKQVGVETPLRLTSSSDEDRSPSWSPDGNHVAFVRRGSLNNGIYIAPALGGASRQVVDLGERMPNAVAWSPDGRTLAYTAERTSGGPFGIATHAIDTGQSRQITAPPSDYVGDHELAFSPDGRMLAFVRGAVERVDDIFVVDTAGGEARRLTFDHAEVTGLDWSADGREVIFSSDREGAFALWRIPVAGGSAQWIPVSVQGSGVHQPSVARAGGGLAYIQRHQEVNVWRLDRSGESSDMTKVIGSTRWDSNPSLSPDGERIAYSSNRSGSYEIWVADSDGASPVKLTSLNGPFANTPTWSPDGSRIAFAARDAGSVDVYVLDVRGGAPRRLTTAGSNDQAPFWSRDGEWIYFGSNRTGSWQVWKVRADGGGVVQVTRNGGFAAQESVDGAHVFFVKRDEPGLWQMPTDGGPAALIIDDVEPFDWANWAPVENGVYYVGRRVAGPTLNRYDLAAQNVETVLTLERLPRHPALAMTREDAPIFISRVDRIDADIMMLSEFR